MNKIIPLCFVSVLMIFSTVSCKKGEGQGGNSSITGKVYGRYYNKSFTFLIGSSAVPKEDVYIIYGNELTYGDNQKTNSDGTYEFKYLRKGHYKVYAYSKDTTQNTATYPSGLTTVVQEIDITDKKQTISVPNFVIIK